MIFAGGQFFGAVEVESACAGVFPAVAESGGATPAEFAAAAGVPEAEAAGSQPGAATFFLGFDFFAFDAPALFGCAVAGGFVAAGVACAGAAGEGADPSCVAEEFAGVAGCCA
jgi:hypothetical protein